MILMIDNYDSFTYNLVEYLKRLKREVKVVRNDKIDIEEIRQINPNIIVISPGPCTPNDAGISKKIISELQGEIPILGICLGHQAIGEVFGAEVVKAIEPVHGKVSIIRHNDSGIFKGLKNPLKVTRYHSLIIKRDTLPKALEVTAETKFGEVMGIQHKVYPITGVQFHPEAILTEQGLELLRNFLEIGENYDHKKN